MDNIFKSDGLFLHASSVVIDGRALLFLGHSTAGKSTIARLLSQQVLVLADDSVFAYRGSDHLWRVLDGGFRFGESDLSDWQNSIRRRTEAGEGVPLAGCLRLHKAEALRIEPLPPLETARCLMDAVMEIDLQRKSGRLRREEEHRADALQRERNLRHFWFRQVSDMARTIPGWNLWFSPNPDVSDLLEALRGHLLPQNS